MKRPQNNPLSLEITQKLARLAAFTELNPRPIIEINFKGIILDQNSSAKSFFPDLKERGAAHPYISGLKSIIKSLKKEGKPFTRDIKVKDAWFRQVFYYISSFKLIHIYGSDITQRKQAEDALQKSELRYRSLFNKMNEGYALKELIMDKKGRPVDYRFLDVNPAYENFTKISRINMIGKTARQLFGKKDLALIKAYEKVVLKGEPLHFEKYYKNRRKYYEIFAHKTEHRQFAVLFFDITDRKRAEEEKNNFISIMSHELRNPLTPILANSQLISAIIKDNKAIDPMVKEATSIIERQSKNMAQLLDDILDVSRMSRDKITLEKQVTGISQIVRHAIETTMPHIVRQHQKLSVSLPKKELYASVDPLRFEQIIVNLINNATKYTKTGGHIRVICSAKNGDVQVMIKDNGIGMDPRRIEKMFDLFSRANQPTMGIGGMGIGLNLVKNLVAMHGGTIKAKSQGKNKGSEFMVAMPAVKKHLSAKQTSVKKLTANPPVGERKKILVVDDNEDIAKTIARILETQGYQIKIAHNGPAALKMIISFSPDTVLLDIRMPGMSGYDVAKKIQLRQKRKKKKITLIAMTGYGQAADKKLAQQAGFDHHLTKPIDIADLLKLLV